MPKLALASSLAKPASSRALRSSVRFSPVSIRTFLCVLRLPTGTRSQRARLSSACKVVRSSLLAGERTALNFLQQLSGVATLTRCYVEALSGTATRITDTRKTTPGWRHLQKWAVRLGGGVNHRMGLYDAVLIKENHAAAAGGVRAAIRAARGQAAPIYVEAENLAEVEEALVDGPDRILLDNMDAPTLRRAVALIRAANPAIEIEATGGYTLATVRAAAAAGVDLVSIGALTHSAPALDLSMLFEG